MIIRFPTSPEGQQTLASRVSVAHAGVAVSRIQSLNCPIQQKLALIDAVIQAARDLPSAQHEKTPPAQG